MSAIPSKQTVVPLDDILMKFSLCGRYYISFILIINVIHIYDAVTLTNFVFTAQYVKYWCADGRFGNDSCASVSNSTEQCAEWVYDDPTSFVAEFDLACQDWKRTLVGSANALGHGFGLLLIGPLSDRVGRKSTVIGTAVISAVLGLIKRFSYSYWVFIILELVGTAVGNAFSPAYILTMEMVAHKKRVTTKVLCALGHTIGNIFLPLVAWLCPYWRDMLYVYYVPSLFFISFIFLLDESPRWLLSKGRKEKAIAILQKTARISKVELGVNDLNNLAHEDKKEATFMKSIKNTLTSIVLLKRFLMCLILWIACAFVNYGLNIYSVSLPGNKYINFGLMGIVGLPSKLLTYWMLKKFTRRIALINTFFLCAVVCIVQPFTSEYISWFSIVLFVIGNLLIETSFSVTYIFTSELFPTYTRNSMHALCSSLGRIGSILTAQTPLLMVYWHGLPSLLFGAVSLLAGVVTLFAPDTSDEALPDNVRQAETIGHSQPANTGIDNGGFSLETTDFSSTHNQNAQWNMRPASPRHSVQ